MYSIGQKIEELRKNAGMTQEELAEVLEVSRQSISQWEADTVSIKADKLKMLCEYFNVKPEFFLFENSDKEPLVSAIEEETVVVASEEIACTKKRSRKKTVFIACAVVFALLASAIIFFIAWLEAPTEGADVSVSVSAWGFDIATVLQIIAGAILFAVIVFLIVLIVKYVKNRKK